MSIVSIVSIVSIALQTHRWEGGGGDQVGDEEKKLIIYPGHGPTRSRGRGKNVSLSLGMVSPELFSDWKAE